MGTGRATKLLLGLAAVAVAGVLAATALAGMSSQRLGPDLCETNGGARIVGIPGFPGETIDRRLLNDIKVLERRYKIFVTDGHSDDAVHAANGEHPLGLALDIVPNAARGGTWRDINALAAWAEPRQDRPIAPFRWVGYNGDAGHGTGHHLHLSWNHSETKPGVSPATVYTLRCPSAKLPAGGGGTADGSGKPDPPSGSQGPKGNGSGGIGTGSGSSGGISVGRLALPTGPPVVETGGADGSLPTP